MAHVDITHSCHLSCANCTRFVGHHRSPQTMTLDEIRTALRSYRTFPGRVGLMGGETTIHPRFREILAIMREEIPDKDKREFWTAGWKWLEYIDDIYETFHPHLVTYNDHTQTTGKHQPLLIAIDEVIDDKALMWELIDECWIQKQWSPTVTKKGAFFCEVAAAQDHIFNGPGGWDPVDGWWDKTPDDPEFREQVERYCTNCSAAIPMGAFSDGRGGRDGPTVDVVSPRNLERLLEAGSPKARRGHVEVFDRKLTREDIESVKDWKPSHFRDFEAWSPEDVEKALTVKAL